MLTTLDVIIGLAILAFGVGFSIRAARRGNPQPRIYALIAVALFVVYEIVSGLVYWYVRI